MATKEIARITSVKFRNYKALRDYQIRLSDTNFLVGPNNAGKSTIISAFRILAVGLKKTKGRRLDLVQGPNGRSYGVIIPSDSLPVSIENVHTDLTDEDTTITFRLSNGNELQLFFSKDGPCLLIANAQGTPLVTAAAFRNAFPLSLAVIPVLAPVEHSEHLVLEETVERNISTHRAPLNFRSYWYYNEERFEAFAEKVLQTWPGMKVSKPKVVNHQTKELMMLCEENRFPRELFWIGSGFQIWCQLLTHIFRARFSSLIVVDEPEIYLHADLQRQLVALLRTLEADVLLATHSTEIMGEADPHEMVLIDKRNRSAERLKNVERLQSALVAVGSIHNVSLSRLARSRKVVFFEDESDFKLIRLFARQLGFADVASGLEIFPALSEGFGSWQKVANLGWGIERALDSAIRVAAVFDRDYYPAGYISEVRQKLEEGLSFAHIFERKEIENYLLMPAALQRALESAMRDKAKRDETALGEIPSILQILEDLTQQQRRYVLSQLISREVEYTQKHNPREHSSSLHSAAMQKFEEEWSQLPTRLKLVPGKTILQELREKISLDHGVSLTNGKIVAQAKDEDISEDMRVLVSRLEDFRVEKIA